MPKSGRTAPAPTSAGDLDPASYVGGVLGVTMTRVADVVKPAAAAAIATTFSFPLGLMIAVVLFLIIQRRVDDRDPKLRAAPRSAADMVLAFHDEDEL